MAPGDNDQTFIDRLAFKLFASPGSPFTAFADRQRAERLENCRQLERVLKDCQAADDARTTEGRGSSVPAGEVKMTSQVKRISRFFRWDEADAPEQSAEDGGNVFNEAVSTVFDKDGKGAGAVKKPERINRFSGSCAREVHELWACRALALGCGGYLAELRDCWSDTKQIASGKGGGERSCRDIQIDMSKCVNKRAAELVERMQKSKKQ
ncbi:hypothetical protein ACHAXT_009837 [Thalassiosira profunda]